MAGKRKFTKAFPKKGKKSFKKRAFKKAKRAPMVRLIKQVMNKQLETKHVIENFPDGRQFTHMSVTVLDNRPYYSTQGITNPNGAADSAIASTARIGDMVLAKGVRYRMFVENNERFAQVKHRFMFVRGPFGGLAPSITTLFMGRSDNKLIDDINTSRFTILYDKTHTIYNSGLIASPVTQIQDVITAVGLGTYSSANVSTQPGCRVITIYIPYAKNNKPKALHYTADATGDPKDFAYYLLYLPYVVQNTSTTLNVCKLNDMNKVFYFKDT